MKFPSISDAAHRAADAFARFPFVILCGAAAAVTGSILAYEGGSFWTRALLSSLLGLPLFFALALLSERLGWSRGRALAVQALALAVPALFLIVALDLSEQLLWTRALHLAAGLHLSVAIVSFVGRPAGTGFWQFNRILLLRFLLGALFTAVLFAGLALSLAALDQLFGIDIDHEVYLTVLFTLMFLFSPWFFAAGVPRDVAALDARDDYPTGLKVFAQFVLIPLVTIDLLILTAYLVRVLVTRSWPSGWIGWLVSGIAVTGTLALLLVHPLREREDSRWVNAYGRWFFVALLPSIAMLLMAIGLRIQQYGVTERRYFLLVLAITLAVLALWYAFTASRNIRIIPAVLAVVAFFTFAGPWSAYAVARRSQLQRLEAALARNGMLSSNGRAVPAERTVSMEDTRHISGATGYLIATHGEASLVPVLIGPEVTIDPRPRAYRSDERARELLEPLGVTYLLPHELRVGGRYFYANVTPEAGALDLSGWDWLFDAEITQPLVMPAGSDTLRLRPVGGRGAHFSLSLNGQHLIDVDVTDQLLSRVDMRDYTNLPQDSLTYMFEGERADVQLRVTHFNGHRSSTGDSLTAAHARVLVRLH